MHCLVSSSKGLAWIFSSFPFSPKVLGLHDLLEVTQLVCGRAGTKIEDSGLLNTAPSTKMKVLIKQHKIRQTTTSTTTKPLGQETETENAHFSRFIDLGQHFL